MDAVHAHNIPFPEDLHYIEVMCNSILYGVYAVLIVAVVHLLMTKPTMPFIHKMMFGAGVLMFVITTVELGLVLQQVTVIEVPLANARAQVALAMIQFMIGDSILIWRVWAVWNRNWWPTILPICLMMAAAGARISIIARADRVREFVSDIASMLILANVGICTLLIGGRIWFLHHQAMNSILRNTYKGVFLLIIESGCLIFVSQLLAIILSRANNEGVHTVLDIQIPLTGMLPTLIVLFVHLDIVPGTRAQEEFKTTKGEIIFRRQTAPSHPTNGSVDGDVEMAISKIELEEWKATSRSRSASEAMMPPSPCDKVVFRDVA